MTTTQALAERYGAPTPWRRRTLIAVVAVVVLSFAGWLAWTVWDQVSPEVSSEQLGFTIVDASTAQATVQIEFRNDDVQAECTLQAFAADHTLVGEIDFQPNPSAAGDVYVESIKTERLATSVESIGCTAPGQTRPR